MGLELSVQVADALGGICRINAGISVHAVHAGSHMEGVLAAIRRQWRRTIAVEIEWKVLVRRDRRLCAVEDRQLTWFRNDEVFAHVSDDFVGGQHHGGAELLRQIERLYGEGETLLHGSWCQCDQCLIPMPAPSDLHEV